MWFVSRIRMPLAALGVLGVITLAVLDVPGWVRWSATGVFVIGMALYFRIGTPTGRPVPIAAPVRGSWVALNSPSSRVPSHGIQAWAQAYAVDLVCEPADRSRPGFGWWPLVRRPGAFPGFGQPVLAPVTGDVVRAYGAARDHLSRTSPIALLYLLVESVRELLGPLGVLGNYVVIRRDERTFVLVAHLRRARCGWSVEIGSSPVRRLASAGTPATRPSPTSTSRPWTGRAPGSRPGGRCSSTAASLPRTDVGWWSPQPGGPPLMRRTDDRSDDGRRGINERGCLVKGRVAGAGTAGNTRKPGRRTRR